MYLFFMRVCLVSPYSPREVGGVGRFLIDLGTYLRKQGHDIKIVTRHAKSEILPEALAALENDLVEIDCSQAPISKELHLARQTRKYIQKNRDNIDIIHTQRPLLNAAFAASVGNRLKIPVISTTHGKWAPTKKSMRDRYLAQLERYTFKHADAVTFVDESGMDYYGVPGSQVITNGIDIGHFQPNGDARIKVRRKLGLDEKDFALCFTGRIARNKGVYEILEALSIARGKRPEAEFVAIFLGNYAQDEKDDFKRRIGELAVSDSIKLLGIKSDVAGYLQASDAFVLPSYFEGLPLSVLEAMGCALPVIVTKTGGLAKLVKDGENGLFVEKKNAGDLAEKILMLSSNRKLAAEIGARGAKHVARYHSLEEMGKKYVELYDSLIKKGQA